LEDLRHNSRAAKELVDEVDLKHKLEKRMLTALTAIRDSQADFEKAQSLECDTSTKEDSTSRWPAGIQSYGT
jgi:hypothetical protein